jgi:hypothetical protein
MTALSRIIWCWYALPLLVSLALLARILLYSWDLVACGSCEELQVFVVGGIAFLPWLSLCVSYVLAWILLRFRMSSHATVGHIAAGPLVVALALFFVVNTEQYLP